MFLTMRRTFATVLVTADLTLPGCSVLTDAIFASLSSKRRIHKEPAISKEERQAHFEEDFRQHMKDSEKRQRLDDYYDAMLRQPPDEWEKTMDGAFPER